MTSPISISQPGSHETRPDRVVEMDRDGGRERDSQQGTAR